MNYFQSFNGLMFGGIFAGVGTALFRSNADLANHPLKIWFFVTFLLLFRLKISRDDHKYFAKANTKTLRFKIGLLFGVVSWVLWLGAALNISNLRESFYIAGWSACPRSGYSQPRLARGFIASRPTGSALTRL
jgi:hypothetical protein